MRFSTKELKLVSAGALAAAMIGAFSLYPGGSSYTARAAAAADAAGTFKAKCAVCHGADGSGNTGPGKAMKLKDLRSAEVKGQSDAALYAVIANGKGKMQGYEKSLGADTCKALVGYVRQLK